MSKRSAASNEDEISAFIAHLEDRAVARRRPGAVSLRGSVADNREADFTEEFQRRQPVLRVLFELFQQIREKYAAIGNRSQSSARHRRPARQIVQFGDGARCGAEGFSRQKNAPGETRVRDQQYMFRPDPANGVPQITV